MASRPLLKKPEVVTSGFLTSRSAGWQTAQKGGLFEILNSDRSDIGMAWSLLSETSVIIVGVFVDNSSPIMVNKIRDFVIQRRPPALRTAFAV